MKNLPERNPQEDEDQESRVDDDDDEDQKKGRKIHCDDSLPLKKRMKQHGNEIPHCHVCKKSFPSLKSLYGRMKLHGGSNSKAFRPPSPKPDSCDDGVSSSCNDNIDTDADAASFLVNLAKIEIRRHGTSEQCYSWETSTNLDGLGDQMSGKKAMQEQSVRYKDNPSSKKLKFDDTSTTGPVLAARKGKRKASMEDDEIGDETRVSKQCTSNTPKKIKIVFRGEDPKRDVALHDQSQKLQIPRKPQVEYSIKTLPTSQAMGTPSWYSNRNRSDDTSAKMGESGFSTKYAAKRKYDPGHVPISTKDAPVEHNIKKFGCNICNKKFTTFQGLGGHRSDHNSKGLPVKEAPTAPEVRASTDNEDDETEAALHKEARDDVKGRRNRLRSQPTPR